MSHSQHILALCAKWLNKKCILIAHVTLFALVRCFIFPQSSILGSASTRTNTTIACVYSGWPRPSWLHLLLSFSIQSSCKHKQELQKKGKKKRKKKNWKDNQNKTTSKKEGGRDEFPAVIHPLLILRALNWETSPFTNFLFSKHLLKSCYFKKYVF